MDRCRQALLGKSKTPMRCTRAPKHDGEHEAVDPDTQSTYSWSDPHPRSKFHNTRITIDGVRFDSLGEASHYVVLLDRLRRHEISNLVCHPSYELKIGSFKICRYVSDFSYTDSSGQTIVEDWKSAATMTDVYRLKKKLMLAILGIRVVEVGLAKRKK